MARLYIHSIRYGLNPFFDYHRHHSFDEAEIESREFILGPYGRLECRGFHRENLT